MDRKKNKLKVAHILNSVGGVDVSLRLILGNIDSLKFDAIVLHGTEDTDIPFLNDFNEPVRDYKLPIEREVNLFKDFRVILNTIKILRQEKPDVIHAHSAKGGIVGKVVGYILNIPVLHTPQAYSYLSAESNFKRNFYLFVERCFRATNNKIVASSESEQNRAIKEVGYKKENTIVFNNSINPITEIEPLQIKKTWPDDYICSVGRPSFQKNIELMLDVLLEVKNKKTDIHLVLMGVGYHSPNLKIIQEKIKDLRLEDNITLLEWTSRNDIFNIIENAQFYITTARYEGLPYSVIESLALGKAVIATDVDGNRDLVKSNFNGYLIPNHDKNAFSEAILSLIDNKETLMNFSVNSLKLFNEKFSIKKSIVNLEQIYLDTLKD